MAAPSCPHCTSTKTICAGMLSSGRSAKYICRYCERTFSDLTKQGTVRRGHWDSLDTCQVEALKYDSRSDFSRGSRRAYAACLERGWLNKVCLHMRGLKTPDGTYTYERCEQKAALCSSKKEFRERFKGEYRAAHKNKIIERICTHMRPLGHIHSRLVYSIRFKEPEAIYVGITFNIKQRIRQHKKASSMVGEYLRKFPYEVVIEKDYIPLDEAVEIEKKMILDLRLSGKIALNAIAGGGIGSNKSIFTKEIVIEIARKCRDRTEFLRIRDWTPMIKKLGIAQEIEEILPRTIKPVRFWNKETLKEEAKKYKTLKEFMIQTSPYSIACKLGILEEITGHMRRRTPNGYWNYERCLELAKESGSKQEFFKKKPAYLSAHRHGSLFRLYSELGWDY